MIHLFDMNGFDDSSLKFAYQADSLPFPQKLFTLLNDESNSSRNIIAWLPNGLTFKIFDTDKFENEVIPKYFKR